MYKLPKGQVTNEERVLLHKLRVWIAALGIACLVVGISVGALLAGHPAVAQNEAQVARAPEALSASFVEIARRVEPAVVNIDTFSAPEVTERRGGGAGGGEGSGRSAENDEEDGEQQDEPSHNPLLDMLRRRQRRPVQEGVGSGFIVDPKGFILTNKHVVEDTTRISVSLQSGEKLRARVVGIDDETDLAVLKVETPRELPTVKLGNSDQVEVGDWVLAIGSPFGLAKTVTAGIISTKDRQSRRLSASVFQRFLQTDAAINRGNSGGPLVNMRGEVVGINSQIATSTGDYNGIGFALPANEVAFVYRQITAAGKVQRGYLGVTPESVRNEYARIYGLPEAKGAIVTDVPDPQSPAAKAGIQPNDIIVELNSQLVISAQDLIGKVAATPVGETIQLAYLREANGKFERRTTSAVTGDRARGLAAGRDPAAPAAPAAPKAAAPESERPRLGLTLSELTPPLAAEYNLRGLRGLFVKDADESGLAADAGLRTSSVIERVNRVPMTTLADFEGISSKLKPGDPVVMHVAIYNEYRKRIERSIVQFTFQ